MVEKGIYFGKSKIYQKIRNNGGIWNDSKERPLVCLVESTEMSGLFWAIPIGNWNHRDKKGQDRINTYLNYPEDDLRSCYYHIGKTSTKSIFFISDVIPITKEYIDKEYKIGTEDKLFVIKNPTLLSELNRKLERLLSFENSKPNYFRQRITDLKNELIIELESEEDKNDTN